MTAKPPATNIDSQGVPRGACSCMRCLQFRKGPEIRCANCGCTPVHHQVISGTQPITGPALVKSGPPSASSPVTTGTKSTGTISQPSYDPQSATGQIKLSSGAIPTVSAPIGTLESALSYESPELMAIFGKLLRNCEDHQSHDMCHRYLSNLQEGLDPDQIRSLRQAAFDLTERYAAMNAPYFYYLYSRFFNGDWSIEKDAEKHYTWAEKAAKAGCSYGFNALGHCCLQGLGTPSDPQAAFSHWEQGAKLQNPTCINYLGEVYQAGVGCEKDQKKAFDLFQSAANLNNILAIANLADCYLEGKGVPKDPQRGIQQLERASKLGYAAAMVALAVMRLKGEILTKDATAAINLFYSAAQVGSAQAMYYLGICVNAGIGAEKNTQDALYWFQRSADLENAGSMFELGDMYYEGNKYLNQNKETAFFWWQKSAKAGNVEGMIRTAECYQVGVGTKKDWSDCIHWLNVANEKGHQRARARLAELRSEGFGKIIDGEVKSVTEGLAELIFSSVQKKNLTNQIENLEREKNDLEAKVQSQQKEQDQLQNQLQISRQNAKELQNCIENLRRENQQLLMNQQSEYNATSLEYQQKISDLRVENQHLKFKLDEIRRESDDLSTTLQCIHLVELAQNFKSVAKKVPEQLSAQNLTKFLQRQTEFFKVQDNIRRSEDTHQNDLTLRDNMKEYLLNTGKEILAHWEKSSHDIKQYSEASSDLLDNFVGFSWEYDMKPDTQDLNQIKKQLFLTQSPQPQTLCNLSFALKGMHQVAQRDSEDLRMLIKQMPVIEKTMKLLQITYPKQIEETYRQLENEFKQTEHQYRQLEIDIRFGQDRQALPALRTKSREFLEKIRRLNKEKDRALHLLFEASISFPELQSRVLSHAFSDIVRKTKGKFSTTRLLDEISHLKKIDTPSRNSLFVGELEGQQVAVKEIKIREINSQFDMLDSSSDQSETTQDFMRELCTLCKLNNPSIIRLITSFINHPNGYLVMPYYKNGNLNNYVHRCTPDYQTLHRIFHLSLQALQYLHQAGIIHSDFKPANILIDDNGNPILCDFDASKDLSGRETGTAKQLTIHDTQILTTRPYAPPEFFGSQRCISPKSDVYSFGASLFEIMGKRDVSKVTNPLDLQHLLNDLQVNNGLGITPEFIDLVKQCLKHDYKDRPSTSQALQMAYWSSKAVANVWPPHWTVAPHSPNHFGLAPVSDETPSGGNYNYLQLFDKILNWRMPEVFGAFTGIGRDSHGLMFDAFEVISVSRVENGPLYSKYIKALNLITEVSSQNRLNLETELCDEFNQFKDSGLLQSSANEQYLFHCPNQNPQILELILQQGLDPRIPEEGLVGAAVYFAENPTKADEYGKTSSQSDIVTMMVCRVALGSTYMCVDPKKEGFNRDPVKRSAHKVTRRPPPIPNHPSSKLFDSVMVDCTRISNNQQAYLKRYREFVIYNGDQCYPEFLITYRRRNPRPRKGTNNNNNFNLNNINNNNIQKQTPPAPQPQQQPFNPQNFQYGARNVQRTASQSNNNQILDTPAPQITYGMQNINLIRFGDKAPVSALGIDSKGINSQSQNPNYNQGNPNYNQGNPNYNQGNPNYNQGNLNYNQGNLNYNQGNLNYNQGNLNYNQGNLNYNQGNNQNYQH